MPNAADDEIPFDEEDGGKNEGGKSTTNGRGARNNKGTNRSEEHPVMPDGNQVMIRTIPPDIGRLKLEEVGLVSPALLPNAH